MNRVLLGVLATSTVFVLTSFAFRTAADPAAKRPGGPAWTVSQYQLDRAFRYQLPGPLASPMTAQMPATGGIIITQLKILSADPSIRIDVNGAFEDFTFQAFSGPFY